MNQPTTNSISLRHFGFSATISTTKTDGVAVQDRVISSGLSLVYTRAQKTHVLLTSLHGFGVISNQMLSFVLHMMLCMYACVRYVHTHVMMPTCHCRYV